MAVYLSGLVLGNSDFLHKKSLVRFYDGQAWLMQIGRTSADLRSRLHTPPGERFRPPSRKNTTSYDNEDVDAHCNELLGYFERDMPLSVDVVRRAVFREAIGQDGYEETQVDAFLDRVVELMAAID